MNAEQCPLCFLPLEPREVAPCMDCGHDPEELVHYAQGKHSYAEYRIFDSLSLILCDFCHVDFGSYDPAYFGLPTSKRVGLEWMSFLRVVSPPGRSFDKYCPGCRRRLGFLKFVSAARELHQNNKVTKP